MAKYDEGKLFDILAHKSEAAARKYMSHYIPETLTKFYSLTDNENLNESKISAFKDNWSWFDYATEQNDKLEFKTAYFDEEQARAVGRSEAHIAFEKKMSETSRKKLLLCCFTEHGYKNESMWSEYAKDFNGYCIQYRVKRKEIFFQVHYQDDRMALTNLYSAFALVCHENDVAKVDEQKERCENAMDMLVYFYEILFSIKETKWAKEKEYRIISVPYAGYEHKIPNDILGLEAVAITIGYNCKEEYKERLKAIVKRRGIACYLLKRRPDGLTRERVN